MFKRLDDAAAALTRTPVILRVDGADVHCREGDTVAAALFAAGVEACRDTVVNDVPRGPYCMMGVCYDCLVTIDGKPNQQACMTLARAGMDVERQRGARKVTA
ncbi:MULTISPECIES: (2Fe-2S)-binding protein [unclassified Achromobacter]|jgi:D-hydroxyproline dehydrogenase subunit gamma|uniref:(2Fe-2S)-binding protein n=1 Tax=unclassified Achromobacter TaxID=2626865 RepID=UPI000B51A74E|nr:MULTISPECIES: (2Fe-2S)-binding protein [unclassified Achromobacter]OWT69169.1 (2Fe-2S)-binding protein [Achromobacter sp. HZ34]OWT70574.1 (2Fe-2S)-binding protein [Achromobacter sp. HZ28]